MNIQDRRVGTIHRWWSDRVENGGKIDGSEDHNVGREGSMHRCIRTRTSRGCIEYGVYAKICTKKKIGERDVNMAETGNRRKKDRGYRKNTDKRKQRKFDYKSVFNEVVNRTAQFAIIPVEAKDVCKW